MKRVLLFILSSIFVSYSFAQPFNLQQAFSNVEEKSFPGWKGNRILTGESDIVLSNNQKCLAKSTYINGQLNDTFTYTYGGNRFTNAEKSSLDINYNFDSLFLIYSSMANPPYSKAVQTFDAQDRLVNGTYYNSNNQIVATKNIVRSANGMTISDIYDEDDLINRKYYISYEYDTLGRIVYDSFSQNYQNQMFPTMIRARKYEYNERGLLRKLNTYYLYANNGFYADGNSTRYYYYDGINNKPYMDSLFLYESIGNQIQSTLYYYDIYNRSTRDTTFQTNGTYLTAVNYTYSGDTVISTLQNYNNSSSIWSYGTKTVRLNNNDGNELLYELYSFTPSNNSWGIARSMVRKYNTDGFLIDKKEYSLDNNVFAVIFQDTIHRNEYNNPTLHSSKFFNPYISGSVDETVQKYYYDNSVNVSNTKKANAILQLYPNPAKDELNISTNIQGKYLVKILDVSGRERMQVQKNTSNSVLNTQYLPSGAYWIMIEETKSGRVHSRKFVKD